MPVMDEFREERESIKHGTLRQKYQYFKDYYRLPLIIFLVASVFIGSLIYQFVTSKDSAFYAVLLNCSSYDENEWFTEEYAQLAGIDLNQLDVMLDSGIYYKVNSIDQDSYITSQKLETYVGAGQLDVMLGAGDEFAYYANSILFRDMREVLSPEQIQKYEPYFYYVDAALWDAAGSISNDSGLDFSDIPNPRNPQEMEHPIPVAIYVESSETLNRAYYFKNAEDGIAIGIYANAPHLDNALNFIDYLFTE